MIHDDAADITSYSAFEMKLIFVNFTIVHGDVVIIQLCFRV